MTEIVFRHDFYARLLRGTVRCSRCARHPRWTAPFLPDRRRSAGRHRRLRLPSGAALAITDTIKGEAPDEVIHVPAPGAARPNPVPKSRPRSTGRGATG